MQLRPFDPNMYNNALNLGKAPKTKAEAIERAMGAEPCETCSTRKYQDGSSDAGVSFKTPQHIAPENSAAMVAAHEREHVVAAHSKAQQEGHKVVSATTRLFSARCPECGKFYIAGGEARIKTASQSDAARFQRDPQGQKFDMAV
jgi:hypothetical protein